MKKLSKLKLSNLSKTEMTEKEQDVIRGGAACVCICNVKCGCFEVVSGGYFYNSMVAMAINDNRSEIIITNRIFDGY